MARTTFVARKSDTKPSKTTTVRPASATAKVTKPTKASKPKAVAKPTAKPTGLPTIAADADPKTWPDGFHACACGCGSPTKRTFRQGHDAKVHAFLLRVARKEARFADLPTPLKAKEMKDTLDRMVAHAKAKAAA